MAMMLLLRSCILGMARTVRRMAQTTPGSTQRRTKRMAMLLKRKDDILTQKKQRIQWSGQLQDKFLEAIDQIGIDKAVPKKIMEVMNVDGLSRGHIASHLQKYRIYLKRLNEGTQPWWSGMTPSISNKSASQCFPSGPSSSSANISDGVVFNTSIPFSYGTSASSSANTTNDSSPLATRMRFTSSHSQTSFASILRTKMLEANRGIPFDAENFFDEITNGFSEQVVVDPFNSGSNANSTVIPIGYSDLGSSSNIRPTLSNFQIGNSVVPTQMPNGGSATGNLPDGGVVDQQVVGDQVNNSNELPGGTSETRNGGIDGVDDSFVDSDWGFF
ncbi:hypothetical protein BAE44_0000486 [Dichanthelium oligosanthes]|uniref:HTH myb-type domain-containing protein n=1 Tax=Dichanthelium oligosanthes TaxID=888268 RepID=A0A1E5WM94_9POAL|nr:hypothetical protein BAE44_0000486 [Dichanthelium oligosanthes]